jgi:hypothetical protein
MLGDVDDVAGNGDGEGRRRFGLGHRGEDFLVQRAWRFFLAALRHAGPLVDVLCVARRATGLLDLVLDHGDDRMVGHAPFARTVVVQCVTETQPALVHRRTRSPEDFREKLAGKRSLARIAQVDSV